MPLGFPCDHVLDRSIRLMHEIRITRRLRDHYWVVIQTLEAELHDLLASTQPYDEESEYYREYHSELASLNRLYDIAVALYHWHEMHVRHCRDEREHLQACLANTQFRLNMYGPHNP